MKTRLTARFTGKFERLVGISASLALLVTLLGFSAPDQVRAQSPRIAASISGGRFWTADFAGGAELRLFVFEMPDAGGHRQDGRFATTTGSQSRANVLAPPLGYHDFSGGDVPSWDWTCNAAGWAMDPDAPDSDVLVRILVDGQQLFDPLTAASYRPDLETAWNDGGGGCPGGTCAFDASLWSYLTPNQAHEILIEAQDLQSGEWSPLYATPKTITCRTYDIYAFDTLSGRTRRVTDLQDSYEYNPKWSPDGKKVAHDRLTLDFNGMGVYITDFASGVSAPLPGAETGSNPAWSPNGRWIAFSVGTNEAADLYILPPNGGVPKLVTQDGAWPAWSPNSKRLVFFQPSDGSLRTVDLKGGGETIIAEAGFTPAWSPNGQWISYDLDGDLWKVAVDRDGNRVGDPVRLTSHPTWEGRTTWSANSRRIVFHAGYDGDTDIWSIPAAGGAPTRLTGGTNFDDYDPHFSNNGRYIAYSSYTPLPEPLGVATFTYDPPEEARSEGSFAYRSELE